MPRHRPPEGYFGLKVKSAVAGLSAATVTFFVRAIFPSDGVAARRNPLNRRRATVIAYGVGTLASTGTTCGIYRQPFWLISPGSNGAWAAAPALSPSEM